MKKFNPRIHHRKSIRLKGYDYSKPGFYFVTICVKDFKCFFGEVFNGKMILNDAGKMVERWYYELENKFPDIKCHEMVVMPNHFHCILQNTGPVRADLSVCPESNNFSQIPALADLSVCPSPRPRPSSISPEDSQDIHEISHHSNLDHPDENEILGKLDDHTASSLYQVIQWFKTMSTNEYIRGVKTLGWPRFNGKLWHRNYYEKIIRNQRAFQNITNYIQNNPEKWDR